MKYYLGIIILVIGIISCKKDEPAPATPETPVPNEFKVEDLLKNWSGNIIVPNYEQYKTAAAELNSAVGVFKGTTTTANLESVKTKWKAAYLAWQKVSMYEFGPAADIILRGETNIYPTDTTQLNDLIAQGSIDLSGANKLDVKGFPALDYLLNNGTSTEVVDLFKDSNTGSNRMNYLVELSKQINNNATAVHTKWSTAGGDYSNQFNSAVGTDVGSSLGLLINTLNQHIERHLRDGKLGIPNGNRNFSATALPSHVEAPFKGDISVELAQTNLEAIELLYLGNYNGNSSGLGLDDYLESLNAKYGDGSLNGAIKTQFTACKNALKDVPSSLKDNLISNKSKVDAAVKELQKLIVLHKTDVPSATGILITYQDNDGD